MTDIPDHLRQISLGEETDSTSYKERDRNKHIIPQVDGTVVSRDSLNWTLDSIDLTVSPVKYSNAQRDTEKINEDTNDNDTDEMVKCNKDKARKVYGKDRNEQRDIEKTDEDINDDAHETVKFNKGRATKVYEINTEKIKTIKRKKRKSTTECKRQKSRKGECPSSIASSQKGN